MSLGFEITARCGRARRGRLRTPHGPVDTPAFMAVGTTGSVKALDPEDVRRSGTQMILGNTYHLMLRPGEAVIKRLGGLHRFMAWPGPILTDSGGFQIFSLARLRDLDADGVTFRSHLDGSLHRLTPERAVEIQEDLGADVIMCLDDCPPYPASRGEVAGAVARTSDWAARCRRARRGRAALFGIVQGGVFEDLRLASLEAITGLDFEGYAVGGVSVGEGKDETYRVLDWILPRLPEERPRYVMGLGAPEDLVEAVSAGADMFDCVLPTRNARNGQALTRAGRLNIRNAAFTEDDRPLDQACGCYTCRNFSRAYLRHLFLARELAVYRLLTIHNLTYYQDLAAGLRQAIVSQSLEDFHRDFYQARAEESEETSTGRAAGAKGGL